MGRLFNVVGLIVVLGCEVATREATPIAVLAAAPAGETKAEKAARRAEREAAKAAKAAKAGGAEKAGKAKGEKKVEEQPDQPVKPAKPVKAARVKPTASDVTLPACPQDNALTYRSFGAGFLRTWCTGCHSSTLAAADRQDAPEDVNFDRPDLYKLQDRLVYERAVLEGHKFVAEPSSASPMPPAGVVPAGDLRRLGQWIACGSPGA